MLTKKDVDLLIEHFVTRAEFDQAIGRIEEKMVTKEENNRLYDLVDQVLSEVKAMREEQVINSQRFDDTDREIQSLKKDLKSWKTNN